MNPFDDEDDTFLVLVNEERQHSLWPEHIQVPPGWEVALGGSDRPTCLDYIERTWTDMRSAGLSAQRGEGG